jgi:hypothetical protein
MRGTQQRSQISGRPHVLNADPQVPPPHLFWQ